MTAVLESVQSEFQLKIASLTISPETIVTVLQYAMEVVEITAMTGEEKKKAVMELVRRAVTDAPISDGTEVILLEMIDDGIISHMIDAIVSASRGKFHLNALASTGKIVATNCVRLSSCLRCLN